MKALTHSISRILFFFQITNPNAHDFPLILKEHSGDKIWISLLSFPFGAHKVWDSATSWSAGTAQLVASLEVSDEQAVLETSQAV